MVKSIKLLYELCEQLFVQTSKVKTKFINMSDMQTMLLYLTMKLFVSKLTKS